MSSGQAILVLAAGSPGLKFAPFEIGAALKAGMRGIIAPDGKATIARHAEVRSFRVCFLRDATA